MPTKGADSKWPGRTAIARLDRTSDCRDPDCDPSLTSTSRWCPDGTWFAAVARKRRDTSDDGEDPQKG